MSKTVWVLTREYNDYDQHGQYFEAAFSKKPSIEHLAEFFNPKGGTYANVMDALSFVLHVHNGGGRRGTEEQWWNLQEVELDKNFGGN